MNVKNKALVCGLIPPPGHRFSKNFLAQIFPWVWNYKQVWFEMSFFKTEAKPGNVLEWLTIVRSKTVTTR